MSVSKLMKKHSISQINSRKQFSAITHTAAELVHPCILREKPMLTPIVTFLRQISRSRCVWNCARNVIRGVRKCLPTAHGAGVYKLQDNVPNIINQGGPCGVLGIRWNRRVQECIDIDAMVHVVSSTVRQRMYSWVVVDLVTYNRTLSVVQFKCSSIKHCSQIRNLLTKHVI